MAHTISLLGFFGATLFLLWGIVNLFRINGKAKWSFILSGGCIILHLIGLNADQEALQDTFSAKKELAPGSNPTALSNTAATNIKASEETVLNIKSPPAVQPSIVKNTETTLPFDKFVLKPKYGYARDKSYVEKGTDADTAYLESFDHHETGSPNVGTIDGKTPTGNRKPVTVSKPSSLSKIRTHKPISKQKSIYKPAPKKPRTIHKAASKSRIPVKSSKPGKF
ncbi:hypothetical protein [Paenibacillus humicola]|uniref:hypothetical protein n=1 Tax=Paenibacillus humicola TaxID=3110540 RepID=UPI00237AEDA3|nr:hypothetical protein [Paenibacillus humicola]